MRRITAAVWPLACLVIISCLLLSSNPVLAQSSGGLQRRGSGSLGGGVFVDLSGDAAVLGSHTGVVGPLWSFSGAVFVSSRVAVGAEWATLGTDEMGGYVAGYGDYQYVHRTSALFGVVRARAVARSRASLDVVGGIGPQFSTAETHLSPLSGSAVDNENTVHHWAFVFGADVPVVAARHLVFSPFTRFYLLRGNPISRGGGPSSQTAIGVGVTAAVRW